MKEFICPENTLLSDSSKWSPTSNLVRMLVTNHMRKRVTCIKSRNQPSEIKMPHSDVKISGIISKWTQVYWLKAHWREHRQHRAQSSTIRISCLLCDLSFLHGLNKCYYWESIKSWARKWSSQTKRSVKCCPLPPSPNLSVFYIDE